MLPNQSWDQCITEILAPDTLHDGYEANTDPNLESFQYAQHNIEQWVAGEVVSGTTKTDASSQGEFICYGTVSSLVSLDIGPAWLRDMFCDPY